MKKKNIVNGRMVCDCSEIPFIGSLRGISKLDFLYYGLESPYRKAIARGQGGSKKEASWDGKEHICCHSKYAARHYKHCTKAIRNTPDDFSDLVEKYD